MPPSMASCSLRWRKVSRATNFNEPPAMLCPNIHTACTGKRELCDKVILEDAIAKLQKAASVWKATGQPFFLASGT
jgi:hypothetical protein